MNVLEYVGTADSNQESIGAVNTDPETDTASKNRHITQTDTALGIVTTKEIDKPLKADTTPMNDTPTINYYT
ncbi:hypothetical protein ACF0H5_001518 [Mactra antiquata]